MPSFFSALRQGRGRWAALPLPFGFVGLDFYRRMYQTESDQASSCQHLDSDRFITARHVRQLERDGFVVVHGYEEFMQHDMLAKARLQIMSYFAFGWFTRGGNYSNSVRQDLVCWLRESDDTSEKPIGDGMLWAISILRGVAHAVEAHGYSQSYQHYVARQLQLGWYPGDGASGYVRHFDHSKASLFDSGLFKWLQASDRRARCLTAIMYLNDPMWTSKKGGALRCYHDKLGQEAQGEWTDVIPRGHTLVIFDSKRIEHEVLPSFEDRFALTCWITGTAGSGPSK